MTDALKNRIMAVIEEALNRDVTSKADKVKITESSSMETVGLWDSVNFMNVFLAVNEAFGLEPDFDDAIHYISVGALHTYLQDKVGE